MGKILVTGAAGKTGQAVLQALARRGVAGRAQVRDSARKNCVLQAGADEVAVGDLLHSSDMARALTDIDVIYHICPNVSPDEVEIGRVIIAAARDAGVHHFVYHSVLHPQTEAMPHHWRKLRVEELLLESGLPTTILQPAAYMQNLLAQQQSMESEGVFPVPYPIHTRLSLVDLEDVAEVAAKVLTESGHEGAVYELCGPEAPDQVEIVAIWSKALKREVLAVQVSIEDWRNGARASGLDDERCGTLIAMFQYYAKHGFIGNGNVLKWLLGREPTHLRDLVGKIRRKK